jgi:hypothetical protein
VHLSATEAEARSVGSRHAEEPVLIRIDTGAARAQGVTFHRATDLIWLSPAVPKEACIVPELPSGRAALERAAGDVQVAEQKVESGFKRRTRKRTR